MDDAATPRIPGLVLGRRLGAGSTGTVYAAHRELDGWSCAVKVTGDLDPRTRAEVLHEAGLLGSVRLPHLVALHEVLECADGRLALVLDLVDGGTVGDLLAQRGRFTPAEAVTVLGPVLRTLVELHRRGIVHGDVSAANVLLTREGRPMLTDLGRARLVGQVPSRAGGTPEYLAPEVNAPGPPTAAADVYAAGALGWRMLTGEPVPPGLVRRPLTEVLPRCPPALGCVVDDCLRGDPAARPTPERAADAVLAACRAGPLQLPDGPDPAEQLTLRLRAGLGRTPYRGSGREERAGAAGASGAAGARSTGHAVRRAGVSGTGRHRRIRREVTAGTTRWRRFAPALYTATGLGAFVAATAGVQWFAGTPAGRALTAGPGASPVTSTMAAADVGEAAGVPTSTPAPPPGRVPSEAESGTSSGPRAPASSAPARTQTRTGPSPGTGPIAELERLVNARASAFREADPARLHQVYVPGSAAGAADGVDVAALRRAGIRYDGLRYFLAGALVERVGGDGCVIRVRIDTSRYVVRGTARRGQVRPPVRGVPLRFHLARTPSGWRIAHVRPG